MAKRGPIPESAGALSEAMVRDEASARGIASVGRGLVFSELLGRTKMV